MYEGCIMYSNLYLKILTQKGENEERVLYRDFQSIYRQVSSFPTLLNSVLPMRFAKVGRGEGHAVCQ